MKISLVIPAYNEETTIGRVVRSAKDKASETIVVDDGSADSTAELARQAGAEVLTHFLNRGQGAALQTGIIYALNSGTDVIVTFDADSQFKASEIDGVLKPLLLGEVDVVLGSRFLNKKNQIPLAKKIILKLAVWVTRFYTGLKISDTHNGFRAFSAKAARLIQIKQNGMAHASEIIEQIKKHGLKFREVPVTVEYSEYSLKKGQKLTNSFRIIWDLIIGRITR